MQVIPTQPIPNQIMQVQLDQQPCSIHIYQTAYGMFMDLFVGGVPVVYGVICENLNRIVRDLYLGFSGDLLFNDTQGTSDPVYTGLGSRFELVYIEATELPPGEG